MITGKTFKGILLSILALLLTLTTIGCGRIVGEEEYEGIFSPSDDIEWDTEHEYKTYAVVVSSTVSSSVYDAAKQMAKKLSENTGAYAECFYAHEEIPTGKDVCRIFIGNTGHEAAEKYLRGFRSLDIGYKYHDKCVYIGGITEESLLLSIEKFTSDVVVYADRKFFMNDGTDVFLAGEYDISEIKIDGFSLGEYVIVYPEGDEKLRTIAKDFSARMLSASGYLLATRSDAELDGASRVILIGDCDAFAEHKLSPEPDRAKIVGFDAGLMVVSDQSLAIAEAMKALECELLSVDELGCTDLCLEGAIEVTFESADVSVLSIRTTSFDLSRADMTSILAKVRESYPDIVRFEGIAAGSMESLFYNFDDRYSLIAISNDTYHMIRKDRYSFEVSTANGTDILRYSHVERSTVLSVLELSDDADAAKQTLDQSLGGACLVFSSAQITDVYGVRSAAVLFEVGGTFAIDTAYFWGDTLFPDSYSVTETIGFTYSHTEIKIISFN